MVVKFYVESMASLLGDLKYHFAFDFMDDLLVYTKSFEEHLSHLREVF